MSVLRRAKLRTPDGTESIEYPLGVEAENVEVTNQENLSQRLARIDEDLEKNEEDIAAVSELAGRNKQNIGANEVRIDALERRSASVDKKPYYFNTVADMKAYQKLVEGDMAITLGYYEANDGGNGIYRIVDGDYIDDGGSYHELDNELFAELIINKNVFNVKLWGAKGDGIHDDASNIRACIAATPSSNFTFIFPTGIYLQGDGTNPRYPLDGQGHYSGPANIGTPIYFDFEDKDNFLIEGNNSVILSNVNNSCISNNRGFYFENCINGTIQNITYNGNIESRHPDGGDASPYNMQNAFTILNCRYLTFNECNAYGAVMDGFFIGSTSSIAENYSYYISLVRCRSLYSYRQGLSVVKAHYGNIDDCEFSYTGTIYGTSPKAGIDLEEGYSCEDRAQRGWIIRNSKFLSNKGSGCALHWGTHNALVDGCLFENGGGVFCPYDSNFKTVNNTVQNCIFKNAQVNMNGGGALIQNNYFETNKQINLIYISQHENGNAYDLGYGRKDTIKNNIFKWIWNISEQTVSNHYINERRYFLFSTKYLIFEDNYIINASGETIFDIYGNDRQYNIINNTFFTDKDVSALEGLQYIGSFTHPNFYNDKIFEAYGNRIIGAYKYTNNDYGYDQTTKKSYDVIEHYHHFSGGLSILEIKFLKKSDLQGKTYRGIININMYGQEYRMKFDSSKINDIKIWRTSRFDPYPRGYAISNYYETEDGYYAFRIKEVFAGDSLPTQIILTFISQGGSFTKIKENIKYVAHSESSPDAIEPNLSYYIPVTNGQQFTTTTALSSYTPNIGEYIFYQGLPYWYNGTNWIDATGNILE